MHLLDLALGMKKKGHEVHILVGGQGVVNLRASELGLDISSLKHLIRKVSLIKDFKAYFEIKAAIKNFQPDLVHLHSSKAGVIGRLAASSLNISCVFTAHGWAFTEGVSSKKRWLYRIVERFMSNYSSRIITVSDYDYQLALDNQVADSFLITTVHNGVPDYSENNLKDDSVEGVVKLIMVARFDAPKNQTFLINALAKLKGLDFEIRFVGGGAQLKGAKALARTLGVNEKVFFLGERNDVSNLLHESDIFLLLSNWEGLPLTILEAMSHSLPIIASDVGGISEIIEDSKQGYLIVSQDKDKLVSSIRNLVESSELRFKIGHQARLKYEKEFTLEKMIDKTESVYFQVLKSV